MADWWEKPYKGGGPAKVKGFPRPLYPPDAEQYGKDPSSRGSDVVAYKRTICRLGRWGDWDPSSWDDGYWSDFAHGKDYEDTEKRRKWSGVSGVQWQQHLDATGWLGLNTFNALCYALVPQGFKHEGEQAMDSVAVDMVNEAFEKFQGHDNPPKGNVREKALARAKSQIGYKENPPESNKNKFGDWYGENGVPWCAIFVTWCYENGAKDAGVSEGHPSFKTVKQAGSSDCYDYVPYMVGDARGGRNGLKTTSDPRPGDIVCYDWNWNGEYDHVGLFEKWVSGNDFQAVEGNTSTSNNSNGGEVMRRTRSQVTQGTVFIRANEP